MMINKIRVPSFLFCVLSTLARLQFSHTRSRLRQIFWCPNSTYGCCNSRSGCYTCRIFLQVFQRYVASVCSKCFICFQMYVAASVLSGCYIYFTHMLQVFYLDVAYVSHTFCKCSISTLHMFHTYIIKVCFRCFVCVRRMLHPNVSCCKCFSGHGE